MYYSIEQGFLWNCIIIVDAPVIFLKYFLANAHRLRSRKALKTIKIIQQSKKKTQKTGEHKTQGKSRITKQRQKRAHIAIYKTTKHKTVNDHKNQNAH